MQIFSGLYEEITCNRLRRAKNYMYIREDSIVSSSHNIFAFRFTDSDGSLTKHDESENDGGY